MFSFKEIVRTEVMKKINNLDIKKGLLSSDIPTKITKTFGDLFPIFIAKNLSLCLKKGEFPGSLKIA